VAAWTITRLTLKEAARRRILLAAFLLGIAFLVLYATGAYFISGEVMFGPPGPAQELARKGFANFLSLAGLYAVDFLAVAMAALLAADTLSGEIATGTVQALVTKPVRRAEIVLGKWLGFAILLALYLGLMAGGVLLISYVQTGDTVPNVATGVGLIYLEALVVMTTTLAFSSSLPALATGGVIFGLYGIAFLGGWVEQFGAFAMAQTPISAGVVESGALAGSETALNVGIISSLIIPTEALWRRAAFEMTPKIAQVLGISYSGPFLTLSVPSELMIGYAVLYAGVALAIAIYRFHTRDL
jgi:Cu-processing system permease protein